MAKWLRYFLKGIQITSVSLLVLLAVCTASFRYLLAHLEDAEPRLQAWVSEKTGYHISFQSVEGQWRYFTPSLNLVNFKLYSPLKNGARVQVASLELELDLFETLRQKNLVLSHLIIDGVSLDLTTLVDKNAKPINLKTEIERLFRIELGRFSLRNAELVLKTSSEQIQTISIESLLWQQEGDNHQLEGVVALKDAASHLVNPHPIHKPYGTFELRGYFKEQDTLESITGRFYVNAQDMDLSPWLKKWMAPSVDLINTQLSANAWFDVKKGRLTQAQIQAVKNQLTWKKTDPTGLADASLQQLILDTGELFFSQKNEIKKAPVFIQVKLQMQSDDKPWPLLSLKALRKNQTWRVNASGLSLLALNKLSGLFSLPENVESKLSKLKPEGQINDLRLQFLSPSFFLTPPSLGTFVEKMAYSAKIDGLSLAQSNYFPLIKNARILLHGKGKKGQANIELDKQIVFYDKVFQAPLGLKKSHLALYWQPLIEGADKGFRLWSNALSFQTDYLGLKGVFSLDFMENKSPWLSLYAEGKLQDVGQTWRYLPTPLLAASLTDYLSASLQEGQVNKAQILWQGALDGFPYQNHQGIFQTKVLLEKGRFRFDEKWPSLVDLNATLLFQNDGLFFNASSTRLLNANAHGIQGAIPEFGEKALLSLTAKLVANGESLHQYMMATPLVDSIGAALNQVQIKGNIDGDIALKLPLNGDKASVSGQAFLHNNQVYLAATQLLFNEVKGQVGFNDERLFATDVKAKLAGQAVDIEFEGKDQTSSYQLNLNMKGNWFAQKLLAFFTQSKFGLVAGKSAWDFKLSLKLKDTGFTYHGHLFANLNALKVKLPAPFSPGVFKNQMGKLTVKGDESSFKTDLNLPRLHYLAHVDISKKMPEVTSSHLWIQDKDSKKNRSFLMPLSGKALSIDVNHLDLIAWKDIWQQSLDAFDTSALKNNSTNEKQINKNQTNELSQLFIPFAKVDLKARKLKLGELSFNGVDFSAREQEKGYNLAINSEEIAADALWGQKKLSIDVDYVFLNLPKEKNLNARGEKSPAAFFNQGESKSQRAKKPYANATEKAIYTHTPSIDLKVKDVWLQGYRLGTLDAKLEKTPKAFLLSQFDISSGQTHLSSKGRWAILPNDKQESSLQYKISGNNTSDLMGRFAHTGGIQNAAFDTQGDVFFQGAPWAPDEASLNGKLTLDLKKGYISGVGGAGRLLGLFSFNSILRKMKLDFSGVFEDGLPFDYISGSANIKNGIATANNIKMKALAGEMYINGTADLVNNRVNATVKFIPDLTSGLPVLTAFAVAPQTALYVLALTTVISPVVDAITQVNYTVTGPIDSPKVQEVSRSNALVTLSEQVAEKFRRSKDVK